MHRHFLRDSFLQASLSVSLFIWKKMRGLLANRLPRIVRMIILGLELSTPIRDAEITLLRCLTFTVVFGAATTGLLGGAVAKAEVAFDLYSIDLTGDMERRVLVVDSPGPVDDLYLVETHEENRDRALTRFAFADGWHAVLEKPLPRDIQALDVASINGVRELVVYQDQSLKRIRGDDFDAILAIPSMFQGESTALSLKMDLMVDLNGDDNDDVVMPAFDGWWTALQGAGGEFSSPARFGPAAKMGARSARHVYFQASEPYYLDHNLDGLVDVGFWQDGALGVYQQQAGGRFADVAKIVGEPDEQIKEGLMQVSIGQNADNETGQQKLINAVDDLDGDGIEDMLMMVVEGDGPFSMSAHFEVHRGFRNRGGELEFEKVSSSTVAPGGIPIGNERKDVDGNGTSELLLTSFRFGIGTIIRALITRSGTLNLGIYQMEDGKYSSRPVISRKLTATLDLSDGEVYVPSVLFADIDGDGKKDLMIQEDEDEVLVYRGVGGDALFADDEETLRLGLPQGDDMVQVTDINGDGTDDLILLFSKRGEERIDVVMFRPSARVAQTR